MVLNPIPCPPRFPRQSNKKSPPEIVVVRPAMCRVLSPAPGRWMTVEFAMNLVCGLIRPMTPDDCRAKATTLLMAFD